MSEFIVRPEEGEADRTFIRGLNSRLSSVIEAPTHSNEEVLAFQDRFTATAWEQNSDDNATFIAVGKDGQRLGYVNVRESADEIAKKMRLHCASSGRRQR